MEVGSLSPLAGEGGVGVLPQNALVERIDPHPPRSFERHSRSLASAFYFGRPPMAAYAPPQAGEVE
jgi:hypothetical protein